MKEMATGFLDPGGGNSHPPSYANRVRNFRFQSLDRNILEIVLEKKILQKNINIKGEDVSRICETVGIKVGQETEGYQAHYGRKNITIAVWAKQGVSLERFISENSKDFSNDLTISQVRPAKRREVTLLISGLNFNTPDEQVKHYVEHFGVRFVNVEPVYGVHHEGPWKGQYNGEKRYKVAFTDQVIPMGPYHLLNGAKIRIVYPGNTRTCGRCHQPPTSCPGGGIARVCGEQGGKKVTLIKPHEMALEEGEVRPRK